MAELHTDRLRLRPIDENDLDDLHEIFGDPEAMRFYPGTRTRDELIPLVDRSRELFARDRTGFYAMISKATGEYLGQCGLLWQVVDDLDELEIGYACKPRHWRRGYASEAAIRMRDFGFDELGRDHLISLVRPENEASLGVARRVGMRFWKKTVFKEMRVHVMRIDRASPSGESDA